MPTLNDILTELVNAIRCVYPYETVRLNVAAENKILAAIKTAADQIGQMQQERVEKYRKMAEHYHVAKYVEGELTDECGDCGLDLRDEVHRWKAAPAELEV